MRLFGRQREKSKIEPPQRRILFVSHEATLTGAPQIILNLLKHFRASCDVACESILLNGGPLAAAFGQHSQVDCFSIPSEPSDELSYRVRQVVSRDRNNVPLLAICNSMESRHVAVELQRQGVPSIALVHELPSSYSEKDYRILFEVSQRVVFPCQTVRDQTCSPSNILKEKTLVMPQGLLNPAFGQGISRGQARQHLRRELGLPQDSIIILSCGTLDLRKGCDHFVNIAREYYQRHRSQVPVHFVWVGSGPRWIHSLHHYLNLDIQKSAAKDNIHFVNEQTDVAPYFVGADAFLLTSRVDPFPCVIHEAMATELPIIAFENSGGACEAISDGAGFLVPYADYEQARNLIQLLVNQPSVGKSVAVKALDRVRTIYRFDDYASKMVGLCESIIGQKLRRERAAITYRRAA